MIQLLCNVYKNEIIINNYHFLLRTRIWSKIEDLVKNQNFDKNRICDTIFDFYQNIDF